ncbi:MAG: peptidase domain-containing ABC transporter [Bacteroidales bacterium]|nr:peptidase domain-containing ABC transporter [Bacteroidales bacterium]MBN2758690.1 peptidase domain-containing ABC transporter [Bacteroidales bacterium]
MTNLKQLKKTFTLQHDQSDCGVACLSSLTKYYGGDISIEKFREISGTTKQGTTLLGLYQAANNAGFNAEGNEADIQVIIEHGEPLILHVVIEEKLEHYLVCYGYENNKFIIGDPAKGRVFYTKEELDKVWKTKKCLTLEPNGEFKKTENTKKSKKEWILKLIKDDYELLGISIAIGIVISVLGMAMAVFSQKLIDDILPAKELLKLFMGIALVCFLLIARVVFIAISQFMLVTQTKNFNNRIIDSFYSSLLYLPKRFFDTRKIGELVARLNDTTRIQRVITQISGNFIIDLLVSFTSIAFLFIYSWQTGVIASLSLPVYFLLVYSFNKKIIDAQKSVMQNYAHSESNYISTMNGIAAIKNFNKQSFFSKLNKQVYGLFQDKIFELGKINIKLGLLSGIAGVVFLISILAYTSYLVYGDVMKIGELMAILGIAGSLIPSVGNLALIAIPVNEAKVAFNRMFEFTDIEAEQKEKGPGKKITFENLEMQNISFRFPGRKRLLENVNISLKKGELIAIIGESGSGKSTLGNILQKFYKTETGSILINNKTKLSEINENTWREIIGVVPQDIHIFNGNVIDNICLGNALDEAEQVLKFINDYGFAKFIDALPQGYMTLLGEEGINLSGGQKQIIAFARALYKKPQLLILDEATAAMDRETENYTIKLLKKLKQEISVFYISHRLHILKNISDRIYILENGKIQNFGTHEDLFKTENFYSDYLKEI